MKLQDPELQRILEQAVARFNELPQWMRDAVKKERQ